MGTIYGQDSSEVKAMAKAEQVKDFRREAAARRPARGLLRIVQWIALAAFVVWLVWWVVKVGVFF